PAGTRTSSANAAKRRTVSGEQPASSGWRVSAARFARTRSTTETLAVVTPTTPGTLRLPHARRGNQRQPCRQQKADDHPRHASVVQRHEDRHDDGAIDD